jgi:hypothetical protein
MSEDQPQHPNRPAPDPRTCVEQRGSGKHRELVLVKKGQRYVFRCAPGEEPSLLNRLMDLVNDPQVDLDWFDAAVLSHQIGTSLGKQMQRLKRA